MDYNALLEQVRNEYQSSISATQSKREFFMMNKKLYLNNENQDKKILSKYIWATVQTLRSLQTSDRSIVEFSWRQIGDETYTHNLNKVAKFDYEEMGLPAKRLQAYEDKYLYGCSIEAFIGRDNDLNVPITTVIDPMVWVPDINPDPISWPRFHWFEFVASKNSLSPQAHYNQWALAKIVETQRKWALDRAVNEWARHRDINNYYDNNPWLQIYHHYTTFNGKKYHVTTDMDFTQVIRCVSLKSRNKREENDNRHIPFPVVVRNWIPLRYDPWGVNIFDILADKQMTMQLFDNLARIKAEYEALWDIFLVDPEAVPDLSALRKPSTWPKFIPGKSWWITPVPKGAVASDVWQLRDRIQQNATLDIGLDERSMGVSPASNMTATENQRVQSNANLRILLWMKADVEAEKQFWRLWYRYYTLYFNENKKKLFMLTNDLWDDYFTLRKSDFVGQNNVDVKVVLSSELEEEREKKKLWFMALYGSMIQDQSLSWASMQYIKRKSLELNGISKDEAKRIYPHTAEEEQALIDIQMLNRDQELPPIENIEEDHLTYIMIYDQAKDTPAKQKAILARKQAYILSQQSATAGVPQERSSPMGNSIINQMMQRDPVDATHLIKQ